MMKSLVLTALVLVASAAHAVYSPLECQLALNTHLATDQVFARWSRVVDLDDSGRVTLLIKAAGEDRPFQLPNDPRLATYPESSFESGGDTFALVSGPVAAFRDQERMFAAVNGGRRLDFQVLDREKAPATTLGQEVARRLPITSIIARPFRALDGWLSRSDRYIRVRQALVDGTAPTRARLAARLQARRNPVTQVATPLWREVRECASPGCQTPIDHREDMIFRRLEAFFAERVPGVSLRAPGGLAAITLALLEDVAPNRYVDNASAVERRRLHQFDFARLDRAARLFYLKLAWELVEDRVWADDATGDFIMFEIERTIARFREIARSTRSRVVPYAHFLSPEGFAELADPRHDRLRRAFPVTVVRNVEDGHVWAAVTEAYAREVGPLRLDEEIRRATGASLYAETSKSLATLVAKDSTLALVVGEGLSETVLNNYTVSREVGRIYTNPGEAVWIIPTIPPPHFAYDDAVATRPPTLERAILASRRLALGEPGGVSRQVYADGDQTYFVDFTYGEPAGELPLITVKAITPIDRATEVPFLKELAAHHGIERFDYVFPNNENGLLVGENRLRHLQMDDFDVAESMVKYGIDGLTIKAALDEVFGNMNVPESRCIHLVADGRFYEMCFGSVLNGFAKIKSVTPARPR